MKWNKEYDCLDIINELDKYGNSIHRGDTVIWASASSVGRPFLNEGTVIGFTKSPSFINIICESQHHRIVSKQFCQLVKIDK